MRIDSKSGLLGEYLDEGIPLWGDAAHLAAVEGEQARLYEVLNVDLDRIFARRDYSKPPWRRNIYDQQKDVGRISNVRQTLYAIIHYYRTYGHVPDHKRHWWLRCSDPSGSGRSYAVIWIPGAGLGLGEMEYSFRSDEGGALPGTAKGGWW